MKLLIPCRRLSAGGRSGSGSDSLWSGSGCDIYAVGATTPTLTTTRPKRTAKTVRDRNAQPKLSATEINDRVSTRAGASCRKVCKNAMRNELLRFTFTHNTVMHVLQFSMRNGQGMQYAPSLHVNNCTGLSSYWRCFVFILYDDPSI